MKSKALELTAFGALLLILGALYAMGADTFNDALSGSLAVITGSILTGAGIVGIWIDALIVAIERKDD